MYYCRRLKTLCALRQSPKFKVSKFKKIRKRGQIDFKKKKKKTSPGNCFPLVGFTRPPRPHPARRFLYSIYKASRHPGLLGKFPLPGRRPSRPAKAGSPGAASPPPPVPAVHRHVRATTGRTDGHVNSACRRPRRGGACADQLVGRTCAAANLRRPASRPRPFVASRGESRPDLFRKLRLLAGSA